MTQIAINRINQIIKVDDNPQNLYAIGGYDGVTDSQVSRKYIYASINGGKTWSILNQTVDQEGILTNAVILKMYASSNTTVVFGDEGSFISITVNSGSIWRSAILTGVSTNIKTIYISELNIFVGGNDGKIVSGTIELVSTPPTPPQYLFVGTTYPYTQIQGLSRTISDSAFCSGKLFFVGEKYIYSYTVSTNILELFATNFTSSVSTALYNKIKFNGANGIAVGTDIISYTTDSGTTWADYSIAGITLNDLHILGSNTQAIAVGNGGKIYYTSNTGYSVWTLMTIDTINSSGIGSTIIDSTNDITSINMTDSSTILLSIVKNNDGGVYKSKLFYLNMPNIFNRSENHILDISGCIHTSGDIHISENGKLISNNTAFYMLNETVGNLYLAGDAELVKIGSTKTGNVIVGGSNTLTKLGPLVIGNLYQGNVRIDNNLITGNLYSTNISNTGNISSNNIIIGNNLTISGIELINNTMASTSTNTGALVVSGGVGIGGDIYTSGKFVSINDSTPIISGAPLKYSSGFGSITSLDGMALFGNLHVVNTSRYQGDAFFNGNLTVLGNLSSTSAITSVVPSPWYGESPNDANFESPNYGTAALSALGGVIIAKRSLLIGNVRISGIFNEVFSTTESAATNSGALVISGGLGVCKNTNIGGNVIIYSTTESTTTVTGALKILGGVGIAKNANIGGNATINSTTESSTTSTGALQILGGIGIGKNANIGGNAVINSTTESTTTATGALQILGGIGIAKNINIGGNTNISGNTILYSATDSNATDTGALRILGGIGICKNAHIGGNIVIYSTTESTTTATGALRILGGFGIAKNAHIGGNLVINSTVESTTTATGALQILGGVGVAKNANIGGNAKISSVEDSTNTSTGSLQILGGIGINKNAHIGGSAVIYSTIESTTTDAGALQILGGIGIAKNAHIGGNLVINSTVESTTTATGALRILGGVGVAKNANIGGNAKISSVEDSTNTSTGSLQILGGIGINKNAHIGGIAMIYSTLESTTTDAGAIRTLGGIGIGKNAHIGGNLVIYSAVESTTTATGALQILGGVGIKSNLNVGGISQLMNTFMNNSTVSNISTTTKSIVLGTDTTNSIANGALTINGGIGLLGSIHAGGNVVVYSTIDSTSTGAGAITVAGGVGISGNVNIGGITIIHSTIDSASTSSGALRILGGASVVKNLYVGASVVITNGITVGAASTVTGDFRVTGTSVVQQESVLGSATIAGGLTVAGATTLQATTVAGAFNIGSSGVTSTLNGTILITATTASNTTNTGALIIRGGLGVNGTVTALAFNAVSDVRTKTNINDLKNSGLETLRKLKPKEFNYIDGANDSVYGFIAQDIREVIPKSVIIQPNYIPSIYEYAIVHVHSNTNKITLINKTTIDMAGRKLKIHDIQKNDIIVNITEVIDDKTFVIDENIRSHLTSIDLKGNRLETKIIDGMIRYFKDSQEYNGEVQMGIFIYGIYVEDFHVLNKDTIWTVALIATQEMDLQLQDARQNIKTLEDRIMEIERRLS
jgi:hypothetical protein